MTFIPKAFASGRRRLGARAGTALAVAAALVTVGVIGTKAALPYFSDHRSLCAEFTDAVGLYPGNLVKMLGIEVGEVTAVTNEPDHVRVDFTVTNDVELPADVGAVTYSQSIVTDRHVELTKPYDGGPTFSGDHCIGLNPPRPRSVSAKPFPH